MRLTKLGKQRGFGMTSILLGTAIAGVALAGALAWRQQAKDQSQGRSNADMLSSAQIIYGQYFEANRADIEAAMSGDASKAAIHCRLNVAADGTGGIVSTNSTKHTCAFDATQIRAKGLWPSGMLVDAPGGRYVAIARQIVANGTVTGADDMLVVLAPESNGNVLTTGTVPFSGDVKRAAEQLQASMATMGGQGGFIPPGKDYGTCQYNSTVKQACGNGWAVSLSDFID